MLLQLSLDLYYTEDEIYELSYTKEPKNTKIQVSRVACSSLKSSSIYNIIRLTLVATSFHKRRDVCVLSVLSVGVTS